MVTIRTGALGDIERLVQLMDQLGYTISSKGLENNLEIYGESLFVAEIEGKVVGCLAYHILPQFHSDERHMRIVSLVVDGEHRGKGIGKRLLSEAEKRARMRGCKVIELTSAAHRMKSGAHAFYTGLGYKAGGEKVYFRKEVPHSTSGGGEGGGLSGGSSGRSNATSFLEFDRAR